jgi:hypothetical protein
MWVRMYVVIMEMFKVTELALIVVRQFLLKISINEIMMEWILFNTNWITCFEKGIVIIRYRHNDCSRSRSLREKVVYVILQGKLRLRLKSAIFSVTLPEGTEGEYFKYLSFGLKKLDHLRFGLLSGCFQGAILLKFRIRFLFPSFIRHIPSD